jgi:hypothetical protein
MIRPLTAADVRISTKMDSYTKPTVPWKSRSGEICISFVPHNISSVRVELWVLPAMWESQRQEIVFAALERLTARLESLALKLQPYFQGGQS